MKYLLWLLLPVLLLGQIKTVTQTGVKRSMIRGDATTLTWTVSGDYSSDSLLFIAMDNDSNAVLRLTTGGFLSASYASPKTTITATINAATTENFIAQNYLYDISSVTDSITLIMGLLTVIADVSNLTDTVVASIPYYTVVLDTPNVVNTFLIGQDSTNIWYRRTKDETRTILGIDTLTGASSLPDSLVYDSQISDMVTKSTAQTITGQKNFRGTVKMGTDTTVVITDRITFNDSNFIALKLNNGRGLGNMNLGTYTHNFGESEPDQTLVLGYNVLQNASREDTDLASFFWSIESHFLGSFEVHNEFETYGGTHYKPISMNLQKTTGYQKVDLSFHKIRIKSPDDNADFITFWQKDPSFGNMVQLLDTIGIVMDINNINWLAQRNNYGGYASLIYLDSLNQVVVSPYAGYKIQLGNNLSGDISWRNDANDADITIEPDSLDWVNFDNDAGISVQNLRIRGLQADTTGTWVGDLYADPNTGIVHYNLGANLLTNGDFTNWTGAGKERIPDNWTFTALDTSVSYVEESPTGSLHFATDGSVTDQLTSQVSQDGSSVYGYSFYISQIVDSFNVFMPGWNVVVTQTGYYSGEATSLTVNPLAAIVPLSGVAEITIDNYKIWEKNGAKQVAYDVKNSPLNVFNPSVDDTLFLGRKEVGAIYDSLRVFDIQDSIAIQVFYDDGSDNNLITTVDTLTTDTTINFDVDTIPAGAKVYMYFVFIGDSEAYLRSQIYWRE